MWNSLLLNIFTFVVYLYISVRLVVPYVTAPKTVIESTVFIDEKNVIKYNLGVNVYTMT